MISDEVSSQVRNVLATLLDLVEDAVEQLFRAAIFNAYGGFRSVGYDDVKHVLLDQIRTAVLDKTINKHFDQCFEALKATEVLERRLVRND